jgi:hypothetical protein
MLAPCWRRSRCGCIGDRQAGRPAPPQPSLRAPAQARAKELIAAHEYARPEEVQRELDRIVESAKQELLG